MSNSGNTFSVPDSGHAPVSKSDQDVEQRKHLYNTFVAVDEFEVPFENGATVVQNESSDAKRYLEVQEMVKADKARLLRVISTTVASNEKENCENLSNQAIDTPCAFETKLQPVSVKENPLGDRLSLCFDLNASPTGGDLMYRFSSESFEGFDDNTVQPDGGTVEMPRFNEREIGGTILMDDQKIKFLFIIEASQVLTNVAEDRKMRIAFAETRTVEVPMIANYSESPKELNMESQISLYSVDRNTAEAIGIFPCSGFTQK